MTGVPGFRMRSSTRPSETETFQHFTDKSDHLIIKAESRKRLYKLHGLKIVNSWSHGSLKQPGTVYQLAAAKANRGDVPEWVPWHLENTLWNVWTWWHGCWWFLNKRGYPLRCFNNHVWYLVSKVSRFPMLLVGSWSFLVYSRWTRGWFAWLLSA